MSDKAFNLINPDDIPLYLKKFTNNDARLEFLLTTALTRLLKKHEPAIAVVETLPEDAPDWLREKWDQQDIWHRFEPKNTFRLAGRIAAFIDSIEEDIEADHDWLKDVDDKGRPRRLLHLQSIEEMFAPWNEEESEEKDQLRANARIAFCDDQDGDIHPIMQFANGDSIVRLLTEAALDRESAFLEHCIGDGGYDVFLTAKNGFYSLRDKHNIPRATLGVNITDHIFFQIAGRRNSFPKDQMPEILAFCSEFELDPSPALRMNAGMYDIVDREEFAAYDRLKGKVNPAPDATTDLYFRADVDEIILPENLEIRTITIDDMSRLKKFPENFTVLENAYFYGGPIPDHIPENFKVGQWIITSDQSYPDMGAFRLRNSPMRAFALRPNGASEPADWPDEVS